MGLDENENEFSISVSGENAREVFKRVSKMVLAGGEIQSISVSVVTENPVPIEEQTSDDYEEIFQPSRSMLDNTISFSDGSDAYLLSDFMRECRREWCDTGQIKRGISEKGLIKEGRVSQVLWDLAERGVLRKRECESDGRMKEYKITEKGIASVESVK